jgi:predicted Fe-Mo cluster-binding NifX family protein
MNICIPVTEDKGLESTVSGHFGSAPLFIVVNTESKACRALPNLTHSHGHGACQPLASLAGQAIDGVVVGGIGMGALAKLQAGGIRVYQANVATVGAALDAFEGGMLQEVTPATACAHHGHGAHDHGPHGHGPHGEGRGGPHGSGGGGSQCT